MAGYQFYQVDDEFENYLMYRPDGDNSIWVTLKVIEWDWDASATCTDAHWTLDSGSTPSSPSVRYISEQSTTLPIWTSDFTKLHYEK